jgi:uncharacterized membrane protein YhaH (DUF805 family)
VSSYASADLRIGLSPGLAIRQIWRSFDFRGRATRTEVISYWLFALVAAMALFVIGVVSSVFDPAEDRLPMTIISVLLAIPEPALFVRRVHDHSRSGWWALLGVSYLLIEWFSYLKDDHSLLLSGIATLMAIAILILLVWPGTYDANRFGPDPRTVD